MGKTIGNAKKCEGLYLLEVPSNPRKQTQFATSFSSFIFPDSSNKHISVMLWHYRLGHPNFLYLKKLLPDLFEDVNSKFMQCEVCQLSKYVRNNFPVQGYQSSYPFAIIHSDI